LEGGQSWPQPPLRRPELDRFGFGGRAILPVQVVLDVGERPLPMENVQRGPGLSFEYSLSDISSLDGDRLIESEDVGDNVIAVLAGLQDHGCAVRKIVERIAGLATAERETALAQVMILDAKSLREVLP